MIPPPITTTRVRSGKAGCRIAGLLASRRRRAPTRPPTAAQAPNGAAGASPGEAAWRRRLCAGGAPVALTCLVRRGLLPFALRRGDRLVSARVACRRATHGPAETAAGTRSIRGGARVDDTPHKAESTSSLPTA